MSEALDLAKQAEAMLHERALSWQKWHYRFMDLAKHISEWSKDPSTKVGAVIVDQDRRIVSLGYNGFARGVRDTPERMNDRETKYKMVVHAERNAMLFSRQDLRGCTLYTYPFMPCTPCAAMVIQAGITTVISYHNNNPRWQADFELTKRSFYEARVALLLLDELNDQVPVQAEAQAAVNTTAEGSTTT